MNELLIKDNSFILKSKLSVYKLRQYKSSMKNIMESRVFSRYKTSIYVGEYIKFNKNNFIISYEYLVLSGKLTPKNKAFFKKEILKLKKENTDNIKFVCKCKKLKYKMK